MPILLSPEITNEKVTSYKGVHLYHSRNSFCSRQVRLVLSLKHIEYIGYELDIEHKKENFSTSFLGINPRGLVPTLIHNGKVIIETIDILKYLDKTFPLKTKTNHDKINDKNNHLNQVVRLIPGPDHDRIIRQVERMDVLNRSIQTITLCRLPRSMQKSLAKGSHHGIIAALQYWEDRIIINDKNKNKNKNKTMTLGGVLETKTGGQNFQERLKFWRQVSARDFYPKEKSTAYSILFDEFLKFDAILEHTQYLLGNKKNDILTLVDVTWWVVVGRFLNVLRDVKKEQFQEHVPRLCQWYQRIKSRIEFQAEVEEDTFLVKMMVGYKRTTQVSNATAFAVFLCGLTLLWMLIQHEHQKTLRTGED